MDVVVTPPETSAPPYPEVPEQRAPARPLTASDIMSTPVVTVDANESLWDAWEVLYRTDLRHVAVMERQRCIGVLDDRRVALDWPVGPLGPHRRRVRDLLPGSVHCVLADTPVTKVARIMVNEAVDVVPVVTPDGQLLGLVTATDIVLLVACEDVRA